LARMERRDEALAAVHAARRLFEKVGARTRGAEAAAALIQRLESKPATDANG